MLVKKSSLKLYSFKAGLFVMQNRYSPPSEWIKSVIADGILGDIYMVQLNCYWNRDNRYYKKGGWKGTKELMEVLYIPSSLILSILCIGFLEI